MIPHYLQSPDGSSLLEVTEVRPGVWVPAAQAGSFPDPRGYTVTLAGIAACAAAPGCACSPQVYVQEARGSFQVNLAHAPGCPAFPAYREPRPASAVEAAGASSVFAGNSVTVTAHGGQGTVAHARTIAVTASAGPEQPARQQAPEPAGTVPGAALRVSHADRDNVIELLRQAAGDGRLGTGELDERIEAAASAATYGELITLTGDLPGGVITVPPAPQVRHASRSTPGFTRLAGTCDHGGRRQRFISDGSCRRCGGPAYPYPYPDPRLAVLLSAVLFWLVAALTIVAVMH